MSNTEICLCDQWAPCPNCLRPRTGYARLAGECNYLYEQNKQLVSVLADCRDRYGPNTPHGRTIREALYRATGDESYLLDLPRWARDLARGEQPAQEVTERDAYPRFSQSCGGQTGPEEVEE